jgi:hypothetical protein
MSLTSYRAAPPRDKPLRALKERLEKRGEANAAAAPIFRPQRLPEKAPRAIKAAGAGGMYQRKGALERVFRRVFSFL